MRLREEDSRWEKVATSTLHHHLSSRYLSRGPSTEGLLVAAISTVAYLAYAAVSGEVA